MKTLKNWTTKKLTNDDPRCKGYYHLPHVLVYNGNETILGAGTSDKIHLFQDGNKIILLATNFSHDYAGVTIYSSKLEEESDYFVQSDYDFASILEMDNVELAVSKFFNYSPMYQAKILLAQTEEY